MTVSTGVINAGKLGFTPAMGPDMANAFQSLPMGHFKKIALQFPRNIWAGVLEPALATNAPYQTDPVLYHYDAKTKTSWKFLIRFAPPQFVAGTHVVIAMVGGATAALFDEDANKGRAAALRIIREICGDQQIQATQYAVSEWSANPWTLGAYSYTAPGGTGARKLLAAGSLENRVFFAGEALWCAHYGTAHGAYRTGAIAAARVVEALKG